MNKYTVDNVTYITSSNEKFKTSRISLRFALPINQQLIAEAIVLNELMVISCEKYSSIKSLRSKLDELYDVKLTSNVVQSGKLLVCEINFNFVASKYLPQNIESEVVELINDIVFNPNLTNEEYIENVKNKCILEVETLYDDKLKYAFMMMQEKLDPSRNILIDINSNKEDISKVNSSNLISMHKKLLTESNIVILIDDVNSEDMYKNISGTCNFDNKSDEYEYFHQFELSESEQFIVEKQELNQSKFVIGVKLNIEQKDFKKFQIFNAIYGGYPFSRLFSNIREKKSLAYFVSSGYNPALNLMYIYGGIGNGEDNCSDEEVVKDVFEALQLELDSIASNKISNIEFDQSKAMILSNVQMSLDNQSAIQDIYFNAHLGKKDFDLEQYKYEIDLVTKRDVTKVSKLVNFNTKFLLRGDK